MTAPTLPGPRPAPLDRNARRRARASSRLLPKGDAAPPLRLPRTVEPRLATYRRRSLRSDTSASMARQAARLDARVAEMGGIYDPAVDAFYDDSISARGGAYRPDIERLLDLVEAGHYDGIVVWEYSRWTRSIEETRIATRVLELAACELYSIEEPQLGIFGEGRKELDGVAQAAAGESHKTSRRLLDFHSFLATLGARHGRAPWGMTKVPCLVEVDGRREPVTVMAPDTEPRDELDGNSRADLVRSAARRVLAGESALTIALAWNKAGYPSPLGTSWSRAYILLLLRNPAMAGLHVHRGEIVGLDGLPLVAGAEPMRPHQPVLDDATWRELCETLKVRPYKPRGETEAKLRGLLVCGTCGSRMHLSGKGYRCSRMARGHADCPYNTISAAETEAWVLEAVLTLLEDPELLAAARASAAPAQVAAAAAELAEQHTAAQAKLVELEEMKLAGNFRDAGGAERYRVHHARISAELDAVVRLQRQAERRARRRPGQDLLDNTVPVREAWQQLTPAGALTVISELVDHVTVAALPKGAVKRWRADRLTLHWVTS